MPAIMKRKKCPDCETEVAIKCRKCPVCGYSFYKAAKKKQFANRVPAKQPTICHYL